MGSRCPTTPGRLVAQDPGSHREQVFLEARCSASDIIAWLLYEWCARRMCISPRSAWHFEWHRGRASCGVGTESFLLQLALRGFYACLVTAHRIQVPFTGRAGSPPVTGGPVPLPRGAVSDRSGPEIALGRSEPSAASGRHDPARPLAASARCQAERESQRMPTISLSGPLRIRIIMCYTPTHTNIFLFGRTSLSGKPHHAAFGFPL